MGKRAATYTAKDVVDAVGRVMAGERILPVSKALNIPYRTLHDRVKRAKVGEDVAPNRRGPPPELPGEAEDGIVEWVVARQQGGHPVDRANIIRRGSDISMLLNGKPLTDGWYTRFMNRYPQLTNRIAQVISEVRNSVDEGQVLVLFNTLTKVLNEQQMDASRIFNVDETAFQSRKKSRSVVAARGSSNVWSKEISTSFHMSIVACGSAAGFVVPPLYILPDKSVEENILEADKTGAAMTTAESGFMNNWLFIRWLKFFSEHVPATIQRPLLLIMDGCSSHYSPEVIDMGDELQILLVCLPANATHIFQPLDVAVFGSFKARLRTFIEMLAVDGNDKYSISKAAAVDMAGLAWKTCSFGTNITAGFKGCGLFPLSLDLMKQCLAEFQRNGVPKELEQRTWSQVKSVAQDNILVVPPLSEAPTRKKRVTVAGRLLTRELL
ncbi:hypothetical protein PR003_g6911 [Phytophthora rubi]|uniref:HTH CENPB-type domain-containing protein n=2 Tax=Phytophthora rubi TaxID=129364 RepID=A0A6A4FLB2_9STRA|nr:hypothetical protein PR003_g6911 [Phytophthora rubi]